MNASNDANPGETELLQLVSKIVSGYLSANSVSPAQLPEIIRNVAVALSNVQGPKEATTDEPLRPAVTIRKSVTPEYIICLEDGKKLKMLKRHLRTTYNMSPEQYREKWKLPPDYPMVAPNYAAQRSRFAKEIGLGKKAASAG